MKILKNKITKILNSKNIFDADFYFCAASKIGEHDFRAHTEAKEYDSQIFCVSFTFNNFLHEIGIDKNFEENLKAIIN